MMRLGGFGESMTARAGTLNSGSDGSHMLFSIRVPINKGISSTTFSLYC